MDSSSASPNNNNNNQNSVGISTPRLFIINETQPNNSLEDGNLAANSNVRGRGRSRSENLAASNVRGRGRSRSAVTFEENESNLTNNNNNNAILERQFQSAIDRRRSFINERPKTAISGIVRSYSSSSFESPDENSDSDSSWDEEVISTENHSNSSRTNSTQVTILRATPEGTMS